MSKWNALTRGTGIHSEPKTLVETLGTGRILVEHHRGILGYSEELILISATFGILRLEGTAFRICCMDRDRLMIQGHLHEIGFEGRET